MLLDLINSPISETAHRFIDRTGLFLTENYNIYPIAMRLKIDSASDNRERIGFYRRTLCRMSKRRIKVRGHAPCNDDPFLHFHILGRDAVGYMLSSRPAGHELSAPDTSPPLEGPLCSHTIVKLLQLQEPLYTFQGSCCVS